MDMIRLADGETKSYKEANKEYALVILGGQCTVKGEGFTFENAGKRKDVFDGPATCIYVPANTPFTITAVGEVSIAVSKSPSDKAYKPAIVNPEDVVIKNLGKPGWEREAHFILDERVDSNMLYIGEAYVK
ncbi:MAG: 5-deoxy-glucuronate isomerase, partial [Clostridia bacterium]